QRRIGSNATDTLEIHRRERGTGVKAVPTKPQDQAADGRHHEVVRQHRAAAVTFELASYTRAKNNRSGQGDKSSYRMNDGGPCEVVEARTHRGEEVAGASHRRQEAVRPPGPVSDDRIDKPGDADTVEQVTDKSGASDHCARGNGRTGIRESELEEP